MNQRSGVTVRQRLRAAVQGLRGGPAKVPTHGHPKLANKIDRLRGDIDELKRRVATLEKAHTELRNRIADLDDDLLEQRGLGLRIGELADVVAHLIAEAARGDQERLRAALADFAEGL
jgi:predicted  nucleic acid-binding Zn-ribbon protein